MRIHLAHALHVSLWVTLVSGAAFQPKSVFVNTKLRPNAKRLVLRDVPGEDRTMEHYNEAMNRAFRAAQQDQENLRAAQKSEDTSMMQYILAMNQQQEKQRQDISGANQDFSGFGTHPAGTTMKQQVDSAMASYMEALAARQREMPMTEEVRQETSVLDADWTYETDRKDRPRDQKEMMAYMEAMESVQQQGEAPVESERRNYQVFHDNRVREADTYVPNVEDLSSQHDQLQEQQKAAFVQPMGQQVESMQTIQDQAQNMQQPFQKTTTQQQQFFQQQRHQGIQEMQPDPEQHYSDPNKAQKEHAFQPDPEPPQRNPAQQQQAFQPDPEVPKVAQRPPSPAAAAAAIPQPQQQQQYYKKPQTGSIFDKDYKYKNSVPRIGDMYEMGPPPEGYTDPAVEAAQKVAAQKAEAEAKAARAAQATAAAQAQAQTQAQAARPKQQHQQPQYYKKPQTGSIFDKDYKYKNSVPRIGDMYEMGPPPEGAEPAFPVEAIPPPQAAVPIAEEKHPEVPVEVPAAKAEEPEAETDPEELMAAQMEMEVAPKQEAQSASSFKAEPIMVPSGSVEATPPPPKKKKPFIDSFPNLSSFTDANQDSEYDAYGNLKRKPLQRATSSEAPQPRRKSQVVKEGPPPPDMVIPAVSQLPDWAQNPFPEMGSSQPTASLEAEKRAAAPRPVPATNYAPAPADMVIPAVSQLPEWAQNPFPEMGNSQPTASLQAEKRAAAPRPAPATNYAPAPADMVIPAVSQLPEWAQNPFPEMGNSQPTASLETAARAAPSPAVSPQDMTIPAVTHQQLPAWAQDPFPQMGSSQPTASLEAMGQSPTSAGVSDDLIGCSIEAYSDLPDWVLESQKNGPKAEVIDETFAAYDPTKPRRDLEPRPVVPPQSQEVNTDLSAVGAASASPVQGNAEISSAPPVLDSPDISSTAEVSSVSGAAPVSDVQETVDASSAIEINEVALAEQKEAAAKADEPSTKAGPKSWKRPAEEERHSPFKLKTEAKKSPPNKEKPRAHRRQTTSDEQEDAFAAYMDVMAPIKTTSGDQRQEPNDPMDVFNQMMAPVEEFGPTIPSFGADSVNSVEEVGKRRNHGATRESHYFTKEVVADPPIADAKKRARVEEGDALSPRSDDASAKRKSAKSSKEDAINSSKREAPMKERKGAMASKEDAIKSTKREVPMKQDAAHGKTSLDSKKEENASPPKPVVTAMKQDVMAAATSQKVSQKETARRTVGGAPASAFPQNVVNAFRRPFGARDSEEHEPKAHKEDAANSDIKISVSSKSEAKTDALMAEVEEAMSIYEEAMAIADKGADLRETVQHVLDAESGPLSGWTSISNSQRLFGGKDEAIRAHNHMKEMRKERSRKRSLDAYHRASQNGSPFFMNLNEPTMLMMDLQNKKDGAEMSTQGGPKLMLSTDSDVVESILHDKPDLSTNLLDSTSGSLLVVNDAEPGREHAPRLDDNAVVTNEELQCCDETEQILKRAKISEGYSAWDAFQKLEVEWDALEASKTARYDTKWLRKVQNGVPPPYQFVTEDATWSQPHCWDKLRAQKNQKLDYDVIVAGGSVGIFFAMALQLKGMVVCVVEGADLVVEDKNWKVSMEELLELKKLGIITQDDLEAAVEIPLEAKETTDVLVSPSILIQRVAERFKSGGGTILEQSPMMGIAISEYTGAAVNLGEEREPITASLVLDCIGEKSPIARQRRYGRVPDGVCAVVGSCAAGFTSKEVDEEGGSMVQASEKTELGQERKKQFFWESIPKDKEGLFEGLEDAADDDSKTTYMFTYCDGDEERPPFKSLMDDYWRRLAASQHSTQKPTDLDVKRVMFAYFPTYKNSEDEPQWSRILDLGDLHDSLSVAGLSPMIPHLDRISNAIVEALDNDCLHKDDLAEIHGYIPSLSATWMLQKTMAGDGDEVKEEVINQLVAASSNGDATEDLGPLPVNPYLQDAVSFDNILSQASAGDDPSLLPKAVQHAGLPKVLDWMKHGSMMSLYEKFDKSVAPKVEEKVEKLEPREKFRWRRRLEAWKIGSGRGQKKDRQ